MELAYIQNCRTYAEAMNKINFEVRIPEYYVTSIPTYFTRGPQKPKPIVNGQEVEWDEYLEKHPDYQDANDFVPSTIYKGLDLNMCLGSKNIPEIIDMVVNQVPFEIPNFYDLGSIIAIMDGYYDEMKDYELFNNDLKLFLNRMRQARGVLNRKYEDLETYYRNTDKNYRSRPKNLLDILNTLSVHRG